MNLIVFVLDALRSKNLPPYGYEKDNAPNISHLAKEGAVFLNTYALVDQTDPSFTTIFTGRHPLVHGITRHGFDVSKEMIWSFERKGIKQLPELIAPYGYKSIALDWLGRWHRRGYNTYMTPSSLLSGSLFRKFPGLTSTALKTLAMSKSWASYKLKYRVLRKLGFCWDKLGFCSTEAAMKLLRKVNGPFFLLFHFWDTHTPFHGVPRFLIDRYKSDRCKTSIEKMAEKIENALWRRQVLRYHLAGLRCVEEIEPAYDASIRLADEAIGNFVRALEELHLSDQTLVIITADHGENLVRDGIFIGHGGLYQRVLKVPLIMFGPKVKRGVYKQLVSHLDLVPTILEAVGIKSGRGSFEGKSLLKIFENDEGHDFILAVSSTAKKRYALITERYKFVYSPSKEDAMDKFGGIWFNDIKELYDLSSDDDDMRNLVEDMPDLAKELESQLLNLIKFLQRRAAKLLFRTSQIRRRAFK